MPFNNFPNLNLADINFDWIIAALSDANGKLTDLENRVAALESQISQEVTNNAL